MSLWWTHPNRPSGQSRHFKFVLVSAARIGEENPRTTTLIDSTIEKGQESGIVGLEQTWRLKALVPVTRVLPDHFQNKSEQRLSLDDGRSERAARETPRDGPCRPANNLDFRLKIWQDIEFRCQSPQRGQRLMDSSKGAASIGLEVSDRLNLPRLLPS